MLSQLFCLGSRALLAVSATGCSGMLTALQMPCIILSGIMALSGFSCLTLCLQQPPMNSLNSS